MQIKQPRDFPQTITWNHGIGEVVNSLIQKGIEINELNEYDYSPYDCFNKVEEFAQVNSG